MGLEQETRLKSVLKCYLHGGWVYFKKLLWRGLWALVKSPQVPAVKEKESLELDSEVLCWRVFMHVNSAGALGRTSWHQCQVPMLQTMLKWIQTIFKWTKCWVRG